MTLDRWERALEAPLTIAAVAFLVAWSLPVIAPRVPRGVAEVCEAVTWVTWLLFAVDFAVRLSLAQRRLSYLWRHALDVVVIALPMMRPLRLLRLIPLLRFANRRAIATFQGQVATYVASGACLLWFCASVAALDAERGNADSTIQTFPDAAWWAVATMTTVGYGDHVPVTPVGKLVGVLLMIGGIGLVGTVTATLASWLAARVQVDTENELASVHRKLDDVVLRLARLEAAVAAPGNPADAEPHETDRSE